jgi:NAD(P)-dependent dehydrogenase (short-subunit alcohol dehydrogenase family)
MTALVTGGGGAMGSAIAEELARRGHAIGLADISDTRLGQTAERLQAGGYQVFSHRADVTDFEASRVLVEEVGQALGSIDVLINVVGGYRGEMYQSVLDISLERFDEAMRLNLRSTFILTQLIGRQMTTREKGRIINISSVAGYGATGQADYAAAKAGVMAFTKSCALELAPHVTVNAVAPGVIQTSVMERIPSEVKERYLSRIPLQEFGYPQDVANCVAFLASDDAKYVTGEVINVSGGFLGWM